MLRRVIFGVLLGLLSCGLAQAQTAPAEFKILVVDSQKLYAASGFGQSLRQALDADRAALVAELKRFEDALRAEELRLVEDRTTLSPEAFAAAAADFDARAETIREEQYAKVRDAELRLEEQQSVFRFRIRPVMEKIMLEQNASIILERTQSIFMLRNNLDITEMAIIRIDAALLKPAP